MAGKPNDKWLETMIKKHGSREAVTAIMKEKGARGGRNGKGHEFGHGKVDPVAAGRKGGLVKGELYKRNEVFQEYVPPVSKVEEKPKKRFALWGR